MSDLISRRKSRQVNVGNVKIGSDSQISVQSMLSMPAQDIEANVEQAKELQSAGCQIIRTAVPDIESVKLIYALKNAVTVPIVADIHFDYKIALECVSAGVDKIRINPGNIGSDDKIKVVADACMTNGIPIRIGVNSGSVEKELLGKYGSPTPQAMAESAMNHIKLLEKFDFEDIVVSIKSSNVQDMISAYRIVASQCDYPLHLGVTEAGTERMALIKSSMGIGSLLLDGIGDTIRVSITDNPVKEVYAGFDILKGAGIKTDCPRIVSCPTCGRTKIDMISIANEVEQRLRDCKKPIVVAVMGCAVNGPGEAKQADIGIAGGDGEGLIFRHGEIIRKVDEKELVDELMREIERI